MAALPKRKKWYGLKPIPLLCHNQFYFLEPKRYSVPFFSRSMLDRCSQITMVAMITQHRVLKITVGTLAPHTNQ